MTLNQLKGNISSYYKGIFFSITFSLRRVILKFKSIENFANCFYIDWPLPSILRCYFWNNKVWALISYLIRLIFLFLFVRLGAHRKEVREDTTQEFNVVDIVRHPQYNANTNENDAALIKLNRLAVLGRGVGLVCLGDDIHHLPLDDLTNQCLISGWGTLRSGGQQPDKLQEVTVPLVSPKVCQSAYGNLHASMLCAGFREGGKDSCQGDSGGPLVCNYNGKHYLEGATSWGEGCAHAGKYGVYAKVRFLRTWIDNIIRQ